MNLLKWKTKIKKAVFPLEIITFAGILFMILPVLLILPKHAHSINQQVQEVENIEQNVAVEDGQQAQEFADEQDDMQAQDFGIVTNLSGEDIDTSEYDLIIEVPVHYEKLYPNVEHIRIACVIGKKEQQNDSDANPFEPGSPYLTERITINVENNTYDGIFRFYFQLPPDISTNNWDTWLVDAMMKSTGSQMFRGVKYEDEDPEYPAWLEVSMDGSFRRFSGSIEW